MLLGTGSTERNLSLEQLAELVEQAATAIPVAGKRILIIIPDGTRTMPMPAMFALFEKIFRPQAKAVDYLVALGTHPLMTDASARSPRRKSSNSPPAASLKTLPSA